MKNGTTIVHIQAERTMFPDGTLTYRPLHIAEASLEVNTHEAAKITGLSVRHIQHLCDTGFYTTARKRGRGSRSQWLISRAEVLLKRSQG